MSMLLYPDLEITVIRVFYDGYTYRSWSSQMLHPYIFMRVINIPIDATFVQINLSLVDK